MDSLADDLADVYAEGLITTEEYIAACRRQQQCCDMDAHGAGALEARSREQRLNQQVCQGAQRAHRRRMARLMACGDDAAARQSCAALRVLLPVPKEQVPQRLVSKGAQSPLCERAAEGDDWVMVDSAQPGAAVAAPTPDQARALGAIRQELEKVCDCARPAGPIGRVEVPTDQGAWMKGLAAWEVDLCGFRGPFQRDLDLYAAAMQCPGAAAVRVRVLFPENFPSSGPELWVVRPRLRGAGQMHPKVSPDGRLYLARLARGGTVPRGGWRDVAQALREAYQELAALARVDFAALHRPYRAPAQGAWDDGLRCLRQCGRLGRHQLQPAMCIQGLSIMEVSGHKYEQFERGDRIGVTQDVYERIELGHDIAMIELSTAAGRKRICALDDMSPHRLQESLPLGAVLMPQWMMRDMFVRSGERIFLRQVEVPPATSMRVFPPSTDFYTAMQKECEMRGMPEAGVWDQTRFLTDALHGLRQAGMGVAAATQHTRIPVTLAGDQRVELAVCTVQPSGAARLITTGGIELNLGLEDAPEKELSDALLDAHWAELAQRRLELLGPAEEQRRAEEAARRSREQEEAERRYTAAMEELRSRHPAVGEGGPVAVRFGIPGEPDLTAYFAEGAVTEDALAYVCLNSKTFQARKLLPADVELLAPPPRPFRLGPGDVLRAKGLHRARISAEARGDAKGGVAAGTGPEAEPPEVTQLEGGGPPDPCPGPSWAWLRQRDDAHPNVFNGKYFPGGRPRMMDASTAQGIANMYQRVHSQKSAQALFDTVMIPNSVVVSFRANRARYGIMYGRVDAGRRAVLVDVIYEPRQLGTSDGQGFVPEQDEGIEAADRVAALLGMRRVGIALEIPQRRELAGNVLSAQEILLLCREDAVHGTHCCCVTVRHSGGSDAQVEAFQASRQAVELFREGTLSPAEGRPEAVHSVRRLEVMPPGAEEGRTAPIPGHLVETAWFTQNSRILELPGFGEPPCPGGPQPPVVGSRFQKANREWFLPDVVPPNFSTVRAWLQSREGGLAFQLADFHLLLCLSRSLSPHYDMPRVCAAVRTGDESGIRDIGALLRVHAGLGRLDSGEWGPEDFGVTARAVLAPPAQGRPAAGGGAARGEEPADEAACEALASWHRSPMPEPLPARRHADPYSERASPYSDTHSERGHRWPRFGRPSWMPSSPFSGRTSDSGSPGSRPSPTWPGPSRGRTPAEEAALIQQVVDVTGWPSDVVRETLAGAGWNPDRAVSVLLG
eukprot:TRINITY_DN70172_c0_g1_i1.p1 TRINITY_DN70172_c0_g1~~TRINITY_DN70172_c0_g1_i1.p1  ORF type:complete len:1239 (+),score=322.92 TRINITY_DN70172_c0_g1_i1:96-3812(+)